MATVNTSKKPEILVIAGPNGSGKSTITNLLRYVGVYINADDIKKVLNCTDLEAAQFAEKQRERLLDNRENFTFETVLSTDRNLLLLQRAKSLGYFVRCIYILTESPDINVARVSSRVMRGGHGVPEEKIITRYYKALSLLPKLVNLADIVHIYDNSELPYRIFKKRKTLYFYWENQFWTKEKISDLVGLNLTADQFVTRATNSN